jgi:hypothetical protein
MSYDSDADGCGCLLMLLAVAAAIVLYANWDWPPISSRWLSFYYSVPFDRVAVATKPKDCDFLAAPLGSKGCSYQRDIALYVYRHDVATGRPIVSSNEGKTWDWNDGTQEPDGRRLLVFWRKTTD